MRGKAFAVLLVVASVSIHVAVEAQQTGKVARVGFLSPLAAMSPGQTALLDALRDELRTLGYAEGRNLFLERKYAESRLERLPELAGELVRAPVDLIVTVGSQASRAAKGATSSVPIVMVGVADPVEIGLVTSLARPGGNVTGLAFNTGQQIYAKHLELLREIVPGLALVAVVIDPRSPVYGTNRRELGAAASSLGLKLLIHEVREPVDVERAFAEMPGQRAGAVFVVPNPFVYGQRRQILDLAARQRLPGAYGFREFADDGGLVYYGTDLPAMWRRAAVFVDKILKGTRPAALPVEQPTKFELVLNLRTARSLGLALPPGLLSRADHVIE
jgi:putative ABC transport system substrate-binding protein